MLDDVYYGKDLPASGTLGNSPDRFQVIVRLDKGLPEQAIQGIANSQGGKLEKLLLSEDSPSAQGKGSIYVLSFPDTPARDNIVEALSRRPGIDLAELDTTVHAMLASADPLYGNGILWGMLGPSGDGIGASSNAFGTGADVAWANAAVSSDGKVGSMRTVVGVIDTGIDPLHPDLYLNIWINQNEIPSGLAADQDGDGIITFRDLNVKVSGTYVNTVTDINVNGRIDADDILRDSRWANGVDDDANGYLDDLFGWDFRGDDNRPFEAYSGSGFEGNPADSYHGTHVSGTIGAQANTFGVVGVNWDVQIMPLRFLGPPGTGGFTSDAIEAVYYYTAMGLANPELDFVGTNNSWGGNVSDSFLAAAIADTGNNGHLFVVAAGNSSANNNVSPSYPANYAISSTFQGVTYDPVISVASIDSNGALSSFSNYGSFAVDIAAPGGNIASTLAGSAAFGGYTNIYLDGTSMAAPHVTGAAALIASEFPGLHPADLKAAILNGRTAYSAVSGLVATGGRLNIPGSFALVGPAPTITIADTLLTLADPGATVTFSFSEAVIGFSLADVSVSPGHGTVSDLTTSDNIVWTATFSPTDIETQSARIFVGNRFTSATGDYGRSGESEVFAIDRIAPALTVNAIAATKDGAGANVDGTLSAALGAGETLQVFRDSVLVGTATVNGTSWHFDDTSTLPDGTYQYTARPVDAVGNQGALSGQASLLIDTTPPSATVTAIAATKDGNGANVDGTLSAALGAGETLQVFRDSVLVGTATVNGTSWHFDDETALPLGTYQYTARPVDPSGNLGTLSLQAPLVIGTATDFSLTLGVTETGSYGNGLGGAADPDGRVTGSFVGTSQDLRLTLTGFDIDWATETKVLLNGTQFAYLAQTPNNGTGPTELTIFASQQQAGENVLTFVNSNATYLWGLTDITLEPANPTDFSLTLGVTETGSYGNGLGGAADPDGRVTGSFAGTGQDLRLTLTGFDIDSATETRVLLNGTQFGYLAQTPNNGTGPTELTILASQQQAGENVLTFVNIKATYLWGLTDITLAPAQSTDFSLTLGVTETGSYGNGFGGAADPDGRVTGSFAGTGQDLRLTLTGFDIDWATETKVLLNGTQFAYLAQTPNNGTGPTELTILASQQLAGENVLTFVNSKASYLWGLTDIAINPIA